MITIKQTGDFSKTTKFLTKLQALNFKQILDRYGEQGVLALEANTPKDTGFTAGSWSYLISSTNNSFSIAWNNSNIVDGIPIVILLQYGHGTRNGGYVEGRDFINPTIKPIFDTLAEEIWKEVNNL